MNQNLSVRSYTRIQQTHSHHFNQVVIPLRGSIEVSLDGRNGEISVGHSVVIKKNVVHSFRTSNDSRFLVADLHDLPFASETLTNPFATLSIAFRSYCLFAQDQLDSPSDNELQQGMIDIFKRLLSLQEFRPNIDQRIVRVLAHIENNINKDFKLTELASISCLSVSQFKVLFEKNIGKPVGRYILMLRMERARALLVRTDKPINIIASSTGYTDQSAFSRRFRDFYGISPSRYRK